MQKARTESQQKIIDAARRIIIDQGMEKLTVREIAKQMKLSDGALYRHFKSKKQILNLLIEDIEQTLLKAIDDAAARSADPMEKLEQIFRSHLSYVEQRKGVSFLVINNTLSMKDRALQGKVFSVVEKYLDRIKKILKDGMEGGAFRSNLNLEASSTTFFGMVQSSVTLWGLSDYTYSLTNGRLKESFDFFKKGITAA